MIVVSDASPIISLAAIGQLDLLRQLYGKVFIPPVVHNEILGTEKAYGIPKIETANWIETRKVTNQTMVISLQLELDEGEAEAITLAVESKADLLLLDERKGRIIASRLGLRFIGLMGVLVEAKKNSLIPAIKPILEDLISKAGFWIRRELYDQVLQSVGE